MHSFTLKNILENLERVAQFQQISFTENIWIFKRLALCNYKISKHSENSVTF